MKILVSAGLVVALIAVVFMITKNGNDTTQIANGNNVSIVNGKQIIDLRAKGGYSPQKSVAKAGMPTIVRFTTNGNFDCSSSVRIPSMNLSKNLALSGTTDIDLGSPKEGILHGSCGMGMYPFEIDFQI
jgi:plastocyanin domain-containing protein